MIISSRETVSIFFRLYSHDYFWTSYSSFILTEFFKDWHLERYRQILVIKRISILHEWKLMILLIIIFNMPFLIIYLFFYTCLLHLDNYGNALIYFTRCLKEDIPHKRLKQSTTQKTNSNIPQYTSNRDCMISEFTIVKLSAQKT